MRYTKDQLAHIAAKHALWVGGKEGGECADFTRKNLTGTDLSGYNFQGASFVKANMVHAVLTGGFFFEANFIGANLRYANLKHANFNNADFNNAILIHADLRDSHFHDAKFVNANFGFANLRGTQLDGANLTGVELWGCVGNGAQIKTLNLHPNYLVTYTATHLQIGCTRYPIAKWWELSNEDIWHMDGLVGPEGVELWRKIRDPLRAIIEASPATSK